MYRDLTRPRRRRAAPTAFEYIDRSVITRPEPPPVPSGQIEEAEMPTTRDEAARLLMRDPQLLARTLHEGRAILARACRQENFPAAVASNQAMALRRAMTGKGPAESLLIAVELLSLAEYWRDLPPEAWPAIAAGHEHAKIATQAASTQPAFSAAPFLGALAMRGVALTVVGGGIVARPAGLLNATDRAMLTQHRNAIIEALLRTEEF